MSQTYTIKMAGQSLWDGWASVLNISGLHFAGRYLVEQESSACGSSEPRWDELSSIGQNGITIGTREEASSTDVIQEDPPHCGNKQLVKKKKIPPRTALSDNSKKAKYNCFL